MGDSPALRAMPKMTRAQFINKAKRVLDDMLVEHEEQTGISDAEIRDESDWVEDFQSAMHND